MSESRLHRALREACHDLAAGGARFALVGGLAASVRTEPRFTRDVDIVVAVAGDEEAETLVRTLRGFGYGILSVLEQEATGRLATVRLSPPREIASGLVVDLLFASSGIEGEIVQAAEPLEILAGLVVKVATTGHLIATKVLSRDDARRPQDRVDLLALHGKASEEDMKAAREALRCIQERGYHRGKDLLAELYRLPGLGQGP